VMLALFGQEGQMTPGHAMTPSHAEAIIAWGADILRSLFHG